MSLLEEEWRPIAGYEGLYSVSDRGRVRSEARTVMRSDGRPLHVQERILKQASVRDGALRVHLSLHSHHETFFVADLVADAFLPPDEALKGVRHRDGDRTNNVVTNLERCLGRGYYRSKKLRETHLGERNSQAKVNPEIVRAIRRRRAQGETLQSIADAYGITNGHVAAIVKGRVWGHVQEAP